jgi:acylphosphatase
VNCGYCLAPRSDVTEATSNRNGSTDVCAQLVPKDANVPKDAKTIRDAAFTFASSISFQSTVEKPAAPGHLRDNIEFHAIMSQRTKSARRWIVRGRVQGVGYRYFAQKAAAALGLTGYVRNLDDGNVEVYAAGPETALSDLAARLRAGPRYSDVRGVDEQEAGVQQYASFEIDT